MQVVGYYSRKAKMFRKYMSKGWNKERSSAERLERVQKQMNKSKYTPYSNDLLADRITELKDMECDLQTHTSSNTFPRPRTNDAADRSDTARKRSMPSLSSTPLSPTAPTTSWHSDPMELNDDESFFDML